MKIYYPTYYLVPVVPVISLDQDEKKDWYRHQYNFRCNMKGSEVDNTYKNKDIFEEIDEEYMNEITK